MPSKKPASRLPPMLPTPPMITTTSAFIVNSMPIEGLKVRRVLTSVPARGDERAAAGEGEGGKAANVDADKLGARWIDRQRPQRGAESGVVERKPDRAAEHARHREGEHAVGGESEAEKVQRF